eukprot:2988778-Rhodomonas_salina.3
MDVVTLMNVLPMADGHIEGHETYKFKSACRSSTTMYYRILLESWKRPLNFELGTRERRMDEPEEKPAKLTAAGVKKAEKMEKSFGKAVGGKLKLKGVDFKA